MDSDEPPLNPEGRRAGVAIALMLTVLAVIMRSSPGFALLGPSPTVRAVSPTTKPMPSATSLPPLPTFTSTPTPTSTPTVTPTVSPTGPAPYQDWVSERYRPPWTVDCSNEAVEDGYIQGAWARDFCVPGLITLNAYRYKSPNDFYGLMSSYAAGVMEAQVKHRGLPEGTRGIALMGCSEIGEKVWLRPAGGKWDGPFIVVDCSQKNHLYYHMVGMGLAVEVGFKQTERWGARVLQRVDVHIGPGKPGGWSGVYLPYWWIENALQWEGLPTPEPSATRDRGPVLP